MAVTLGKEWWRASLSTGELFTPFSVGLLMVLVAARTLAPKWGNFPFLAASLFAVISAAFTLRLHPQDTETVSKAIPLSLIFIASGLMIGLLLERLLKEKAQ